MAVSRIKPILTPRGHRRRRDQSAADRRGAAHSAPRWHDEAFIRRHPALVTVLLELEIIGRFLAIVVRRNIVVSSILAAILTVIVIPPARRAVTDMTRRMLEFPESAPHTAPPRSRPASLPAASSPSGNTRSAPVAADRASTVRTVRISGLRVVHNGASPAGAQSMAPSRSRTRITLPRDIRTFVLAVDAFTRSCVVDVTSGARFSASVAPGRRQVLAIVRPPSGVLDLHVEQASNCLFTVTDQVRLVPDLKRADEPPAVRPYQSASRSPVNRPGRRASPSTPAPGGTASPPPAVTASPLPGGDPPGVRVLPTLVDSVLDTLTGPSRRAGS